MHEEVDAYHVDLIRTHVDHTIPYVLLRGPGGIGSPLGHRFVLTYGGGTEINGILLGLKGTAEQQTE